jgi:lysophospholipase L1-like esterase
MKKIGLFLFIACSLFRCNSNDDTVPVDPQSYSILSLGDSYTIGQSVCDTCGYPEQLKDSLIINFPERDNFSLQVIAQTGWTTTSLINNIESENPLNTFDLVTLLIGVNNQYQNRPFSLYETEFPLLVNKAIELAQGDTERVVVISIPDYAFTPFGQGFAFSETTSLEIDQYNSFAEDYCVQNGITFVNITDISRLGLDNPELVATDGLHLSEYAYSLFTNRLLPIAIEKIQ